MAGNKTQGNIYILIKFYFINNFVQRPNFKNRLIVFPKSILATQQHRFELDTTLHNDNQPFLHMY